jgi:hypothetical protein
MDRALRELSRLSTGWFHLVVDIDDAPESELLEEAWQRVGRWHPALRALSEMDGRSSWLLAPRLPLLEQRREVDGHDHELDPGEVELDVITSAGAFDGGPLARLTIVERDRGARLVLSVHHVLADAASGLELFDRLRLSYLDVVDGREPSGEVDGRTRVVESLMATSSVGVLAQFAAIARHMGRWWGVAPSTHAVPNEEGREGGYGVADVSRIVELSPHLRRVRGWRTSAVLLGLLSRAWRDVFGAQVAGPDGWQVASDLRRELGGVGGIGNFSSTEPLTIRDPGAGVDAVVDEVDRELGGLASTWPGLAIPSAMTAMSWSSGEISATSNITIGQVERLRYTRSFSNVGPVPDRLGDWGTTRATALRYAPAMVDPRWVTIAFQGFRGRTLMTMRTHHRGISNDGVSRLGDHMNAAIEELSAIVL